MAPHSSTLAWKIPWTEEPGGLQSMGSRSWTWLSDFTFTFHFDALEKEMVTHSSVLAWRIPGTGEPGGLLSMGSHRVGHRVGHNLAAAAENRPQDPQGQAQFLIPRCTPFHFQFKVLGFTRTHPTHMIGNIFSWEFDFLRGVTCYFYFYFIFCMLFLNNCVL